MKDRKFEYFLNFVPKLQNFERNLFCQDFKATSN